MPEIIFTVPGVPVPKGRPRFTKTGHCFTPQKTVNYETELKYHFLKSIGNLFKPLECPIRLEIVALFPMPKTATKSDKEKRLRAKITKPDLDNIVKCVCDGLNGTAWKDDNLVWSIVAEKVETMDGHGLSVSIKWEV